MKKLIIILLSSLLLSLTSRAQMSIGISAGSNISSMSVFLRNKSTFRINPVWGYNANLIIEYKFKTNFSLWSGMSITQKGFNQHIQYFFSPRIDSTTDINSKLTYLELPIYFKFNTSFKRIDLFYGLGPYVAYGIHGSIITEILGRNQVTLTEEIRWNKSNNYSDLVNYYGYGKLRRIDGGVGTMVGLKYKNAIVTASYKYGLINEMLEYFEDERMSNTSLAISIGYIFTRPSKQSSD